MSSKTLLIDLGSQYSCVLERKLISLGIQLDKLPLEGDKTPSKEYSFSAYQSVILSGSPAFVSEVIDKPAYVWLSREILSSKDTPLLGICFGMQLIHHLFGGSLEQNSSLFGEGTIERDKDHALFTNIPHKFKVWGSFSQSVSKWGQGFFSLASRGKQTMISAHISRPIVTIQFHPELYETEFGLQLLKNFFVHIALIKVDESALTSPSKKESSKFEALFEEYREKLRDQKVLVALSGGVDSSTLCLFLKEILLEKDIYPVFISTGLFPKNYEAQIIRYFREKFCKFQVVDWSDSIFERLKGVTFPEQKRRIISEKFKETFNEILREKRTEGVTYFAQGTVFSDQIESGRTAANSDTIKTHHNVAMVSDSKSFPYKVVEPFSTLFKDEVKELGSRLNLPPFLLSQQPFPGPGLSIRIIGEVTKEKVEFLSEVHQAVETEFRERRLTKFSDQYFPVLLSEESVGVKGDSRVYGRVVVLRAIKTVDYMSANVSPLPLEDLVAIANKLVSSFPNLNRVAFDLTTKPAGTIEWE
ncbi:GMP synthase [Candidatus Mycoplasma haematolamae str. Purdue]|uniref:GMP synthase (glutamine-hydrolyzing) n=1 Tax=Mycoplasma haematolamae (strain Purdue) TaxID=1212765 RepID=I7CJL9_MYCHA|nr:glutamine-hydrolyzing GMP synthase [Candidatus Mycoplasma haematolamae]AFO52054.1 GMP synthase [Candidatus Mycoplasma haematolamae str. Purdue]